MHKDFKSIINALRLLYINRPCISSILWYIIVACRIIIFLFRFVELLLNLFGYHLSENFGSFHRAAVMRHDNDFEIFLFVSHKLPPLSSVEFLVCGLCWFGLFGRVFFFLLCFSAFTLGTNKVIYIIALNDFFVSAYHILNLR